MIYRCWKDEQQSHMNHFTMIELKLGVIASDTIILKAVNRWHRTSRRSASREGIFAMRRRRRSFFANHYKYNHYYCYCSCDCTFPMHTQWLAPSKQTHTYRRHYDRDYFDFLYLFIFNLISRLNLAMPNQIQHVGTAYSIE